MISESALGGYLLEEALAWLLAKSGYRLLISPDQDDQELIAGRHGLLVKGRGANHQADALGEFIYSAPFSLPQRLFLEAKFRTLRTGLPDTRNAFGVVQDVNENYLRTSPDDRPHRRYQYSYALFSTSGFSRNAQEYALAHQLSLIDLSGADFSDLRDAITRAAQEITRVSNTGRPGPFPLGQFRRIARSTLGTQDELEPSAATAEDPWLPERDVAGIISRMRSQLDEYTGGEFLLAFPPAPFVLTLRATGRRGIEEFLAYCAKNPQHIVGLRRRAGTDPRSSTWEIFPRATEKSYLLTFNLPDRIEDWIARTGREREAARAIKKDLLPSLMIYRFANERPEIIRLEYGPHQLGRS